MKHSSRTFQWPALCALPLLLSACGGGGGSPAPVRVPAPPVAPPAACGIQIVADTSIELGKTAGVAALSCGAPLRDIVWTQVGGPAVLLQAAHSSTLAIEAIQAGVIALRADATLADGSRASASTELSVGAAPSGTFVTVRADHAVRPGSATSVRAWVELAPDDAPGSIVWTQVAGPTVNLNTEVQNLLMFSAPQVNADTALRFRATLTSAKGKVDTDEVIIGIERQPVTPNGYIFESTAAVHPYRQAGSYAGVLQRCTYDNSLMYLSSTNNNLCKVGTLPLLAAEAGPGLTPSIAQVMGRVLVSHDFLGANFEQFLLTQDVHGDFRRLLAGVTAIVIGSHVRPSFYTPATGAIYLDANYLWLGAGQRDVVTEVPDYRSSFDDALDFTAVARTVKDNDYAERSFPKTERVTRSIDELLPSLGRLLYHELAHAGDYVEPAQRSLDPARSVWANIAARVGARSLPSDTLATQFPLTSREMKDLGQVMYQGATASEEQKLYQAAEVGSYFSSDVASDDYAYSISDDDNSREDLAMLFEEFMMSYRHGIVYDVGYTNRYLPGMTGAQLIVGWGQRGRIAEPRIVQRISLVLGRVAPWIDAAAPGSLPAPIHFVPGTSWRDSLSVAGAQAKRSARRQVEPDEALRRAREDATRGRLPHATPQLQP